MISVTHPRVAVVIPYFQRSRGLLVRAVASVFDQDYQPRPLVVVIDDSSPVRAEHEILELPNELQQCVMVDRQANAGPGAARNRGLDLIPGEIEYVAFLDSDDHWLPGHLPRAISALMTGRDFYFSNYLDIGSSEGGFETRKLIDLTRHEPIAQVPGTYAYSDDLRNAILTGCPIETSTVVFRRNAFRDLRFRREFRHAYEDLMFWFEAAARSTRVAFSSEIGCQYGSGVNVYRGIQADSDASLRALICSTCFRSGVQSSFRLTTGQRARVLARLRENRKALAYALLHRLRRRRPLLWRELASFLRADPAASVVLPWEMVRYVVRWMKKGQT